MRRRHLLLGHAPPRNRWFADVGAWGSSAAIPVEFVRCVSAAELVERTQATAEATAVLVDGTAATPSLVTAVSAAGVPLIVVDDDSGRWTRGRWTPGAVASVLHRDFTPRHLVDVLDGLARLREDPDVEQPGGEGARRDGRTVMVTGPGGAGASTVAAALAQGAARTHGPPVLLADLCRHADQAMFHDARVLVPGVPELVDESRSNVVSSERLVSLTSEVPQRGYRLLLGMRRPHQWVGMQPDAVERALDALVSRGLMIADVEPDIEGESEAGSVDIEDRHRFARGLTIRADVLVVVTEPTMKGAFAAVSIAGDLVRLGGRPERVIIAVNRAPRTVRGRCALLPAVTTLLGDALDADDVGAVVALPRARIESAHRDNSALPARLCRTISAAVDARLAVVGSRAMRTGSVADPPITTSSGVAP